MPVNRRKPQRSTPREPDGRYLQYGYFFAQPSARMIPGNGRFLIALGVIGALMIGVLAGRAVLIGRAADDIDKPRSAGQLDKPQDVAEGTSFVREGYRIEDGWRVDVRDGYPTITDLEITNVSHHDDWADEYPMLIFTLWNDRTAVAQVEASGEAIRPGESTSMETFSGATEVPAFDRITVTGIW